MAGRDRGPFIAGNWKMTLTLPEARGLAQKIVEGGAELRESTLVLFPPFTASAAVGGTLAGSAIGLGAQDLFWEDQGAYTGEVSGPMLKEAGCAYVLIGHSERRQVFGETDETVNRKLGAALRAGLSPPGQAEEVHAHVRRRLEERYGKDRASCAIILYGGSVKPANSYPLFKEKNIDGFLVGGASLDAVDFVGIAGEALRAYRGEKGAL